MLFLRFVYKRRFAFSGSMSSEFSKSIFLVIMRFALPVVIGYAVYTILLRLLPATRYTDLFSALCGIAVFILMFAFSPRKSKLFNPADKAILRRLARIAVPITVGASIMPLVDLLDAAIVTNSLNRIPHLADQATDLFGILKGMVNPIVNMPAVLTVALAMSLVPAIAESVAGSDTAGIKVKAAAGIKFSLLVGLPACAGLYLLSYQILELLYRSRGVESLTVGATLLKTMSFAILFLSLVQTMTGVLQGLGKIYIPIVNLFIGAVLKAIINFILVSNPAININGAPIGTVVCYTTAAVLNLAAVIRYSGIKMSIINTIVKPLFATALMAAAVTVCLKVLPDSRISTLVCVFAGIAVYVLAILITGVFTDTDLEIMPGGRRLGKLINRFKLHGGNK
ncbi:MAG TPA: polysaccharide biosynthesis C-terminal domain-containing protein, partial [Clostridia bacterium]|nr:polysaccharide biosynthesis C-terminal domain-containing protein [Clostridia bacterium]